MKKNNMNNSFIRKLFVKVTCLIAMITLIIGVSIYQYAYTIMTNEIVSFSTAILDEVSKDISGIVMDGVYLSERIAYNTKLIEILAKRENKQELGHESNLTQLIEKITTNYAWLQSQQHKKLYDVYVFGHESLIYRSDQVSRAINLQVDEKDLKIDQRIITQTIKDPGARGIYQHVFQVHQPIKDHLTGQRLGRVVLNITEKVLYDCYRDKINRLRDYMIIDPTGQIISAKDKRKIGKAYTYNSPKINYNKAAIDGWMTYEKDGNDYSLFYTRIPSTPWYLVEELDFQTAIKPLTNIKIFIYICLLIFILFSMVILNNAQLALLTPVYHIKNQMKKVTQGNLNAYIEQVRPDEFGQISASFNEMLDQIHTLMDEVKTTEQNKRLAELDFLRAQINPHFIYNTLSSIRFFIEMGKNKEAEDMLFYFSKILRATLSQSNQFIKVRDELDTTKNYVALQKLRYAGSFEVSYAVPETMMEKTIPNFILQPIIENAIFYSVQKPGDICQIEVSGEMTDEEMILSIKDNGIGMSHDKVSQILNKDKAMNSIGLKNVHERIQLNYGVHYGLEVMSKEGEGVQVKFKLPRG